jgi:hypothetical protein
LRGGLAGLATQVNDFATANNQTAKDKAEIDRLTNAQTLVALRKCSEMIKAGTPYKAPEGETPK